MAEGSYPAPHESPSMCMANFMTDTMTHPACHLHTPDESHSMCHLQGLGKTLQSLMLILCNPPPASWPVHNLEKQDHDKGEAVPIKTTLIVMPANLLQQWQDELGKHVQDGALKW